MMNRYDALSGRLQKIGVSAAPRNSSFYKQNPSVVLAPKMGVLYIFITEIFFFFLFQNIFVSPSATARKTRPLSKLLWHDRILPCSTWGTCNATRTLQERVRPNRVSSTEPTYENIFHYVNNLTSPKRHKFKKRKEEKQIAQASCWNSKIQRKKKNVPTPSSAQTDPRRINNVEYRCR